MPTPPFCLAAACLSGRMIRIAVVLALLSCALAGCTPKRVFTPQDAPPEPSRAVLQGIDLTTALTVPSGDFAGVHQIRRLRSGALFIQAGMAIDADGSPNARILDPLHGRLATSLSFRDTVGERRYVDAEQIPYIVLPAGFYERFHIELGDLAAVVYRDTLAFAIFADVGPADKLGEGSIKLAELLGHAPWHNWHSGETLSTHGGISTLDVVYIVFPGSRPPGLTPDLTTAAAVELFSRHGGPLFEAIGGRRPGMPM